MKYIYTQTKHSTYMKLHSTIKQEYNTSYIYIHKNTTKHYKTIHPTKIQIYICMYIHTEPNTVISGSASCSFRRWL